MSRRTLNSVAGKVRLQIVLDEDLDRRFRQAILQDRGLKKGDISDVFAEAVELWIREQKAQHRPRS